ncbi:hypothetical protein [Rhodobacter sp. CZR27]|uniref:hypothetical protein n=1 Tax=Rhodobacter sp. CZR27 TaxID=2033869 RepID=UPI000BBECCA0|nr:hypothetical protein [Rhodobacter sp. CZR27]
MTAFRKILLAAALGVVLAPPLEAAPEAIYGPGPRALDNREIFSPSNLPLWKKLDRAGVEGIVLNPSFLVESTFQRQTERPRPAGSHLDDGDLAALARMVAETGLTVTYAAGIGLSSDRCDRDLGPEDLGRQAAAFEFERNVARLLDAGVRVSAINVDGAFLRLLADTNKRTSCRNASGGFDLPFTVRAAQAYMLGMRDRIEAAQGGRRLVVRMLVNLPNWQAGTIPRIGNDKRIVTTDIADVLRAFARLQARGVSGTRPLEIAEIVIDYPYAIVRHNPRHFVARVRHLWAASRDINASGLEPPFGFIVNSRSFVHACMDRETDTEAEFLAFRPAGRTVSPACRRAQVGEDTAANAQDGIFDNDTDYLRDSFTYADALQPGGELARQLVDRDGVRITDHVAHLYFQSWGVNPMSNAWYMERLIGRLSGGR